jgi:2C-methyl-D-erythritol 2,4-cyclodiphosphate synthase
MKIGIGFDVHCLVEGRRLVLGGIEIPSIKASRAIPMEMY